MMDNDPKHTSGYAADWMRENGVNWWKTPAESPDLNPIENLWHELKEYIKREIKPRSMDELIQGIITFWGTVDTAKCLKYIGHLSKVIPKVIALQRAATGYSFVYQTIYIIYPNPMLTDKFFFLLTLGTWARVTVVFLCECVCLLPR